MVNLLPKKTTSALARTYFVRLATLLFFGGGVLFILGALILVPSFFLAQNEAASSERYVSALEETVGLKERSASGESVARLAEQVAAMRAYAQAPITTPLIDALVAATPGSVRVTAISFSRGDAATAVSVAGIAGTRESLLSFADALRTHRAFEGVSLPVSSLVSERDIPFSLSVTFRHDAL